MTADQDKFTSSTGEYPISSITPAMAAAIESADDNGVLNASSQTLNRLIKHGLAVDRRLQGVYLTDAGWTVLTMLLSRTAHRTKTWTTGEARMNWRKARMESARTAAWSCTCGQSGFGANREEARAGARRHRESKQRS